MLPATVRYQVQNATGVAFGAADTLTLTGKHLQVTPSTGAMDFTSQMTPLAAASGNSLASGGFVNSAAIDTTAGGTQKCLQGDFLLLATITTATPAGNLNVYMQESPDGGTTWPANGQGQLIGWMVCSATGAQGTVQCYAR
jgi:hypothetical protein